jgi:hypothetical protein
VVVLLDRFTLDRSQENDCSGSVIVNMMHILDLAITFLDILLVDAELINPQRACALDIAQCFEGLLERCRDH